MIEEELEKDGIRIDENERNQENQESNHTDRDDTPTSSSIEARPYQEQEQSEQGTDQGPEQEERDPERESDQESSVSVSRECPVIFYGGRALFTKIFGK